MNEVIDLFAGATDAEKYQSGNWVAQKLVETFMKVILMTVQKAGAEDVYEIGCGEGHILGNLASNHFKVRGLRHISRVSCSCKGGVGQT